MRRSAMSVLPVVLVLVAASAYGQVPEAFVLHQSDPDPFCAEADTGSSILFEMPQQAYITLEVWSPDTTVIVRSLVGSYLPAGLHMVRWDGRDGLGDLLLGGSYPYTMTAADSPGDPILFEDMLIATIDCDTAVESSTWGRVKALYYRPDGPASN